MPILCAEQPGKIFHAPQVREMCGLRPGYPINPKTLESISRNGPYHFHFQPEHAAAEWAKAKQTPKPAEPTPSKWRWAYDTQEELMPVNGQRLPVSGGPEGKSK